MRGKTGVAVFLVWTAACKATPAPPVAGLTADAGCNGGQWAADIARLGKKAAKGESIVSPEGCSLYDGKLLARGFPQTASDARAVMRGGDTCAPTITSAGAEVTFGRINGEPVVTSVKSPTDERLLKQEKESGISLQSVLLKAARCPSPQRRLKEDKDATTAMTFALASDALQKALNSEGKNAAVDTETVQTLDRVCAPIKKAQGKKSRGVTDAISDALQNKLDPEPYAAMALVMAGSFSVFGQAASAVNAKDSTMVALKPSAAAVLAQPPDTNDEGVCALWTMASAALHQPEAVKKPAPKKKK